MFCLVKEQSSIPSKNNTTRSNNTRSPCLCCKWGTMWDNAGQCGTMRDDAWRCGTMRDDDNEQKTSNKKPSIYLKTRRRNKSQEWLGGSGLQSRTKGVLLGVLHLWERGATHVRRFWTMTWFRTCIDTLFGARWYYQRAAAPSVARRLRKTKAVIISLFCVAGQAWNCCFLGVVREDIVFGGRPANQLNKQSTKTKQKQNSPSGKRCFGAAPKQRSLFDSLKQLVPRLTGHQNPTNATATLFYFFDCYVDNFSIRAI